MITEHLTNFAAPSAPWLTIGVIADTHIPDRVRKLHPLIGPIFQQAGVSHILHAGDISTSDVLEELSQIAPVSAVRGNRDLFIRRLSLVEELELGGIHVALMHGHGGWAPYLWDKWKFLAYGYQLERYLPRLLKPKLLKTSRHNPQVVVFGHTHHAETIWRAGKLLYNPGSASFGPSAHKPPSVGLLHIYQDHSIQAETLPLLGYTIRDRNWDKTI
jgi:predicted phosphodiesterase